MITTSLKATILRLTIAMTFVVTIGGSALAQGRFGVGRFTWEGALYPAFGGTGLVTTDFPAASETVTGMAIDSAGRLIVVGYNTSGVWLVACYSRSTGVLDPSFGNGGHVQTVFPGYAVARAVAVAANGDIVVAGHYSSVNGAPLALARYTSQGVLLWTVATTFTDPAIIDGPTRDETHAVGIDPKGRIVVAGVSRQSLSSGGHDPRIALARYDGNGSLDPTFGHDGLVTTNMYVGERDTREEANGLAFLGNHIVIAAATGRPLQGPPYGSDRLYSSKFMVMRYDEAGSLYPGFGYGGIAVPFSIGVTTVRKAYAAKAIAVDGNGTILAAGRASTSGDGPYAALVRLNGNGSLDTTFSGDGRAVTTFGNPGFEEATAIVMKGSTPMIAGGSGYGDSRIAVLARYTPWGSLDTTFDGDGRATANFNCQGLEEAAAIAVYVPPGNWQTGKPPIFVAGYSRGDPCP